MIKLNTCVGKTNVNFSLLNSTATTTTKTAPTVASFGCPIKEEYYGHNHERNRTLDQSNGNDLETSPVAEKDANDNVIYFTPVLRNKDILPKIFKHLSFESIILCRSVCQAWNSSICSHPMFYKRLVITIRHSIDTILSVFLSPMVPSSPIRSHPSFASFSFRTETMNNSSPIQVHFWEKYGKFIKCLELSHHSLGPVTFLEVLLACPNLQELSFNCAPIYSTQPAFMADGSSAIPSGFDIPQIQKLIPNLNFIQESGILDSLECLYITESNCMPAGILSDLLQWGGSRLRCLSLLDTSVSTIDHYGTNQLFPAWDIRHVLYLVENQAKILVQLELCGLHIQPEHIYALAKMKYLRLRILKLKCVQVSTQSLISLFRRQKYLEELDLSYCAGVSEKAFTHTSCTFYKLKKLSLAGYTSNLDFFSFLSRMMNLVELNLSASRSHSMTWDNLIHSFLPIKLKKLSRLDLSLSVALGSLRKQNLFHSFFNCFKSTLTCLNLSCNSGLKNNLLQILWSQLARLRILYLESMPNISDEGFTGIRQSQLYGNTDLEKRYENVDSSMLLRKHNKGANHIGYCTNLETLSVANNPKLTDFITQYGIRFLSKLKKLKLNGCTKLSDRTLFFLVGSCRALEYLDIRDCPEITIPWVNWTKTTASTTLQTIILEPARQIHHQQQQKYFDSLDHNAFDPFTAFAQNEKGAEEEAEAEYDGHLHEHEADDEWHDEDEKELVDNCKTESDSNSTSGGDYESKEDYKKKAREERAKMKLLRGKRGDNTLPSTGHHVGANNAGTHRDNISYNNDGQYKVTIVDQNNNNLNIPK